MSEFARHFGRVSEVTQSARGRVNLMGDHTDYNQGYVLPTLMPQGTRVELALREDSCVRAVSREIGQAGVEYLVGEEARRGSWVDYVQGVTATLVASGRTLRGFDLFVTSELPLGSGLSSSAALEVAVARALREAFALPLSDLEIAQLAYRAETEFVGVPVGIMDQMASSLGRPDEALFIDTRSVSYRSVPIPPAIELCVIHSGLTHEHGSGEYRLRRGECEAAARALGVASLRDLEAEGASALEVKLRDLEPRLARRVRHVVTENARVLEAVEALERADPTRLGGLFSASHASMRDAFEVSRPEIDLLCALAEAQPEVLGARLTGGGFGGAIVAVVRPGTGAEVGPRVAERYHRDVGVHATVLRP